MVKNLHKYTDFFRKTFKRLQLSLDKTLGQIKHKLMGKGFDQKDIKINWKKT